MNYIFLLNTLFCYAFVIETNVKNSKALKIGKSRGIAGNLRSIFRDVINRTVLDQIFNLFINKNCNIRLYYILNNIVY